MHMNTLECGGQKSILDVFFDCCLPYSLRQGLELNLKLINLARLVVQ